MQLFETVFKKIILQITLALAHTRFTCFSRHPLTSTQLRIIAQIKQLQFEDSSMI